MDFDYGAWLVAYPELANRGNAGQITQLAVLAQMVVPLERIADVDQKLAIWQLAVSHLVELRLPSGGSPASQGLLGRISSAGEGSANVSLDVGPIKTPTQAWFMQTRYGFMLWPLLGQYRMFRYISGPARTWPLINPIP